LLFDVDVFFVVGVVDFRVFAVHDDWYVVVVFVY